MIITSAGRGVTDLSNWEVMPMDYVTWPDLIQFVCMIIELITLVVMIIDLMRK